MIKAFVTAPSTRRLNLGQLPQFSSKDADQATRPNTELRQSVQAESQDSEPGAWLAGTLLSQSTLVSSLLATNPEPGGENATKQNQTAKIHQYRSKMQGLLYPTIFF